MYLYHVIPQVLATNRSVSHKLKYLQNNDDHQLTVVAQYPGAIWRP